MKKILFFITILISVLSAQAQTWTVNSADYEYSMNITGKLQIDNPLINISPSDWFGVFVENECRGIVQATIIDNVSYYFLTIYSNTPYGDVLTFKFRDFLGNVHTFPQTVIFNSDVVYGEIDDCFLWSLTEQHSPTDFYSFTTESQNGLTDIDYENKTIDINVTPAADITSLIADFEVQTGATVLVNEQEQQSGITTNDYTQAVIYTIKGVDGNVSEWTVTISNNLVATDFLDFSAENQKGETTIDYENKRIDITVESNADITNLITSFNVHPDVKVYVENTLQESGVTANNFTLPLAYTLKAPDNSTNEWTVNITQVYQATYFQTFTAQNQDGATAINYKDNTIEIQLPAETDITNLITFFNVPPGVKVFVGNTEQQSGVTANDFTQPIFYTIRGTDGSTANWTVIISNATDISDKEKLTLNIFPNPTKGIVHINAQRTIINSAKIYDISGKKLLEKESDNSNMTMDISFLKPGIYFINVTTNSGYYMFKIIRK